MKTYELFYARDGDTVREEFQAADDEAAEAEATRLVNAQLSTDYPDWEEACADGDGSELEEVTEVSVGVETLAAYRRLADGLSHMVEEQRLTAAHIPDDYQWLADKLAEIAGLDPGPTELPPHMAQG